MRNFINELVQKVHKVGLGDGFDYLKWFMQPLVECIKCGHLFTCFRYVENSNERHRLDAKLSLQQQELG